MIDFFRLPLGQWVESGIDYITETFGWFFDAIRFVISGTHDSVNVILTSPPFWVMILIFAAIAFAARGWIFAVGTVVGFGIIVGVDQWDNAMDTLALVLVAALVAVLISVPLGILAARNRTVSTILKPILDFLQTMPAFVYLIPALILLTMWSASAPALVAEGIGPIAAFGRSRALTKGFRWPVFGALVIFGIMYFALSIALQGGSTTGMLTLYGSSPVAALALATLVSTVMGILNAAFLAGLYGELRDAKEGGSNSQLADVFA